jgi:hypothetical protein
MITAATDAMSRRDILDWIALAVGLIAGLVAIAGFLLIITQRRRRPEVDFLWRISTTGAPADFKDWQKSEMPTIRIGETILVECSIHNIGDASGERALANFVVPDCFSLSSYGGTREQTVGQPSTNLVAGLAPNYGVRYLAPERPLYVDMWWQLKYSLTLGTAPNSPGVRLLIELSDDRLNGRGHRWLPSLGSSQSVPASSFGTRWKPDRAWRRPRWIKVGNGDEVRCRVGTREAVRDLLIEPGQPRQ